MKLIDALLENLPEDVPVRSVLVGAHWTAVSSSRCGLAATLMSNHPHGHVQVRDAGRLHEKGTRELAEYARSTDLLEASIGVAAINSLLEVDESLAVELNASDVLASRGRGKNVALVGHFPLSPNCVKLPVNCGSSNNIRQRKNIRQKQPPTCCPRQTWWPLPAAHLSITVWIICLTLCPPKATVMLIGPSTPLSPILFDYGVDILSGTLVVDEAAALRTIGQGAVFRQVQGTKLLTFTREREKK